jgi:phenylacetate-CoA ligase
MAARQEAGLHALASHAAEWSPWWRQRFASLGVVAEGMTLAGLPGMPVLEREDIRRHRDAMRTTDPSLRVMAKATGGSSGVPLQFYFDEESYDRRNAAWHRGYGWAGAAPGTRQFYLWGVPLERPPLRARLKTRAYEALYRRTVVSCFGLDEAAVPSVAAALGRTRPEVIVAYVNPLYFLARSLAARGVRPWQPRSIVVGAEKLHDFQRETIEAVFRAPVFETYGSREFMLIGAECPEHAGLHLTAEHLIVEVVDDAGRPVAPGVEGDILVTDLHNRALPFIRYRNGDRGVMAGGPCRCGRTLPRLARVTGRRLDVLMSPEGRTIPGEVFPHLLKDFPGVERFQVIQEEPDRIRLLLVAGPAWRDRDEATIRAAITEITGAGVRLEVERVAAIPLTAAGKHLVVVNRLGAP